MSKFKTASPTGTAENPMVVLKRLLRYLKPYRLRLAVVFLCIIFSALASTISATFLKTLINDYIAPLLLESHADYSGLLSMILKMADFCWRCNLYAFIYPADGASFTGRSEKDSG